MGKLAERLADERRSGVYRVEVTSAVEEAAAINGFPILQVGLQGAAAANVMAVCLHALSPGADGSWSTLAAALADPAWFPAPGHVLLFTGFEALVRGHSDALEPLITVLRAAAERRRAQGMNFFAVFLDPSRVLPLDPLYDRRRHASSAIARVST